MVWTGGREFFFEGVSAMRVLHGVPLHCRDGYYEVRPLLDVPGSEYTLVESCSYAGERCGLEYFEMCHDGWRCGLCSDRVFESGFDFYRFTDPVGFSQLISK